MIEYKRAMNTNLVEICTANDVINADFESLATQFVADTQQLTQFCILVTIHSLEGINPLIFWKDPRFGFIHVNNFSRAAILVEAQWVQLFERFVESILTAEIRVFEHTQTELAREWLAAKQVVFNQAIPIHKALTAVSDSSLSEKLWRRSVATQS